MKKFLVNYLSDVAYAMYDSITDDKLRDVMFVGHYEDIIMILKELNIVTIDEIEEEVYEFNIHYSTSKNDLEKSNLLKKLRYQNSRSN